MTKPNKQYQFDLLYVPHNVFEGNTHKYILAGFDFASRCKVARARLLEHRQGNLFEYPKGY